MRARLAIAALAAVLTASAAAQTVAPPKQPSDGPGGAAYPHDAVSVTRLGAGDHEVYLFEPSSPKPRRAPVVVFGHGWGAINPNLYGDWITHIVRRGYTVVYPRYQADLRTPVHDFTRHALIATRRALVALRSPDHVPPDERGLVFVGHSMGGLVASNLAVQAARGELPPPLALMAVAPGRTWPETSRIAFPLDDLSQLPSRLLLLAVAAEDDDLVGEIDARKIYTGATAVERDNRNYVRVLTDTHGAPPLLADHRFASAPGELLPWPESASRALPDLLPKPQGSAERSRPTTDALDYYGTWKLLDGLADAVFRGVHREYALGNTPQQRFMGVWSDGTPVKEPVVEQ